MTLVSITEPPPVAGAPESVASGQNSSAHLTYAQGPSRARTVFDPAATISLVAKPDESRWSHLPITEQERRLALSQRMKTDPVFRSPEVARRGAIALNEKKRSERVAARIAEAARQEENVRAILKVFEDALSPESPTYIRLEAAKALLAIENKEYELALRRQEREEHRDREEIIQDLAKRLVQLQERGILVPCVVDGER